MALHTETTIFIGGEQILAYEQYTLNQNLGAHNTFELTCRLEMLENAAGEITADSQNFLGETITIRTVSAFESEDYSPFEFKGIITKVKNNKNVKKPNSDVIIFSGFSTSIIADDGRHYTSYIDTALPDILSTTFQAYDQSKLTTNINPTNSDVLHYSVQHKESAFTYASRLACQYGEWFYYDGQQLVFGSPESSDVIDLKYGVNLQEFSVNLIPSPLNYKFFTNDYLTEESLEKSTLEVSTGAEGLNAIVSGKSDQIYTKETNYFVNTFNDPQHRQRFDKQVESFKKAEESKQVQITGICDNPGVYIGKVINVIDGEINQGSYRITSVDHFANENGDYINSFEGVSASANTYPLTDPSSFPVSNTQIAKVIDNVDPDGMSRVIVQFPWQVTSNTFSPWLRVLTPHSGANKGMHFIPEINDEVIIGFEGGNAERPYVMGSFYTGVNKPEEWQTDANNVKAIRTRSGHTIELNDTEGEEKINIYDNDGSIITFDTQEKSLTINATENLKLSAKNIQLVAQENIDIQAQGNLQTATEGDTSILVQGSTTVQSTGTVDVSSDAGIAIEATSSAELKGQSVNVEGKTKATLKGMQTKVEGQMTAIQGAGGKVDVM